MTAYYKLRAGDDVVRCEWWVENTDYGTWNTSCEYVFDFSSDGPKENGFEFCPKCGRPVEVEDYDT